MRGKSHLAAVTIVAFTSIIAACENSQGLDYQRYYVNGKRIYETNCQNCHGAKGEGLQALFPPLTDTLSLKQRKDQLACLIRFGSAANGSDTTARPMPGNPALPPIDIAQVIVYITNSFGNKQGHYAVETVENDLQDCR